MGYTHYWRRSPVLSPAEFAKAAEDIRHIAATLTDRGIKLAGPTGHGKPEISDSSIAFNGSLNCHHAFIDLGSPWPSSSATGWDKPNPVVGAWFSGALLDTRICGGNCAAGLFLVDREFMVRPWDQLEQNRYFSYCNTEYKPYDIMVTASLVRLKEHLPNDVKLTSDGGEKGFEDAKRLCRELFGFAKNFEIEPEESGEV